MVIVPQSQPAGETTLFSTSNKTRHPERSAALIYRMAGGLWRGVEGPRRCLLADALPSFPTTNYKPNLKSRSSSEAEGYAVRRTRLEKQSECAELFLVVPMNCHPGRL
jgi:hypothetical protein